MVQVVEAEFFNFFELYLLDCDSAGLPVRGRKSPFRQGKSLLCPGL
jgi:hypothetical protein